MFSFVTISSSCDIQLLSLPVLSISVILFVIACDGFDLITGSVCINGLFAVSDGYVSLIRPLFLDAVNSMTKLIICTPI